MRLINAIALSCALLVAGITPAGAQSSPNWTHGFVPTAGQWNQFFSSKQDALGFRPVNSAGDTMTGKLKFAQSTPASASLSLVKGITPSSPNNGDIWLTASGLYFRFNDVTEQFVFQNYANFSTFFAAWMATLPTTLPATAGVAWNNGGRPAVSQ